jgi:hypothetical protein
MPAFEIEFQARTSRFLVAAPNAGAVERWRAQRGLAFEIHEASADIAAERAPDLVLDENGQPNRPAEAIEAEWLVRLQPWRTTPLKTALRRLTGGLLYVLFASLFVTLFIVFPRGQRESGLLPPTYLSLISLVLFGWLLRRLTGAYQLDRAAVKLLGVCPALALGWLAFSALCPVGWSIPHPLQPYAVVRKLADDGTVKEDEIYRRTAPIVRSLEEPLGYTARMPDAHQHVLGYRYSARYGVLLREFLGEDEGKPNLHYECRPPLSLGFCPRVSCELFAFTAINLFPLLALYALLLHSRERKQTLAEALRNPWPPERLSLPHCLWLAPPFVLGLAPLVYP